MSCFFVNKRVRNILNYKTMKMALNGVNWRIEIFLYCLGRQKKTLEIE